MTTATRHPTGKTSWLDRTARSLVLRRLGAFSRGQLQIDDVMGCIELGRVSEGELSAAMRIHRPRFYRRLVTGGALAAGEAYVDGDWSSDDLTTVLRLFIRNMPASDQLDSGLARIGGVLARLAFRLLRNSKAGSKKNIAAHYDLGNEFYALFLDETMCYSCGIFESVDSTLRDASIAKIDRVCRKLRLQPDEELLEIGTGWGALAIHAAREYGCRVTTTTISRQQHDWAAEKIRDAGLENRITLLQRDYRDLTGGYDKLASIEMIEAVGPQYFDEFFRCCGRLLKPDGLACLQGIVMPEQRYAQYLRGCDFIQKYVFPGGFLPSITALQQSAASQAEFRLVHLEDYGPHYAETLRRWRQQFQDRVEDVERLGFPPEFLRLWDYYLCYCEAAFEERYIGLAQFLWAGPEARYGTPLAADRRERMSGQKPGKRTEMSRNN